MADGTVTVEPATGPVAAIDNDAISDGSGGTVYRQRTRVGGAAYHELAVVTNGTPGVSDYGLVVRAPGAATEATLASVLATLSDMEITTDQISIDAGTINLNTDQLEALTAAVRDRLPLALDADGGMKVHVQNSVAVTGTFWQATQPVSAAALPLPSGASTAAKQPALGTAGSASADVITVQGITSMTPLKTDGSGVTQPVSGTVTANVGTTNGLALDATLTGGTQKTKIVDSGGTNVATVSAAGAQKVDGSAVTQPISAASLPLPTGAATAVKQPALGTAGAASADVITVQGVASMTALKVDGSGVTQPVSGTVTANVGTTNGLALDATLTGGTQKTKLVDTGGTNVGSISAAGALKVDGSAVTQPVSGTVTANVGTTNGLALDATLTGGTQKTKLVDTGGTNVGSISVAGALKVDNSAVTQPISAASLPLPTGAATAVKQPALGTAGSASTDVLTVQGVASMTALKVDGSAVTQPVSGTFFQATQPVSGTVTANLGTIAGVATAVKQPALGTAGTASADVITVQGIASMTALKVDGSGVTQPVSGTVTANLGTIAGVATAAKQPALGAAGTASSDVITVQGIAAMTALKVDGSGVTQPVSGTVTANVGTTNGLALDATLTGGTQKSKLVDSGGTNAASVSAGGALKVDGSAVTQPVSAASLPLPTGASLASKQPALGTAGSASSDVITVQGVASMTALKVDGSAVTQPVSIAGTVTTTGPLTDTQLRATPVPVSGTVNPSTPSTMRNGQITISSSGTRVALAGSTAVVAVLVQALSTNTGSIWVGDSGVTVSNGFELQPGQSTGIAIDNLSKVFVDATTNGDKACFIGS